MSESTPIQMDAPEQTRQKKPKLSPAKRKRRIRRIVKGVLWALFLCALAVAGWFYYTSTQKPVAEADAAQYTQGVVQQGAMDVNVYGSGSIAAANQPSVYVEADGQLVDLRADVGDEVKEGQILAVLKNDTLDDEIASLEYALWDADNTITTTYAGGEVLNIQAPSAGRVMEISAKVGDDALAVYRRLGSVAMLSTDGRMKVQLDVADGIELSYGDEVVVLGEGFGIEGTVSDLFLQGTRAVITVVDDTLPLGATVSVTTVDNKPIGTGKLEINKPMAVSAFGGTIKAVRTKVGDKVDRKDTLFTLEDSPITLKVENLRIQRETAATSLKDAKEKRESLIVRAPVDGVIASVEVTEGTDMVSGDSLCSILQGEEMVLTIAVDELDVVKVAEGQPVNISVDALPELSLQGTVQKIAPVGASESGVSTYDVKLNFDSAGTGVRPGMNASGQIQVAHADSTLYVPVEALMTVNGGKYVMVADGSVGAFSNVPTGADAEGGAAGSGQMRMRFTEGQGGAGANFDPSSMTEEQRAAMRAARQNGQGGQNAPIGQNAAAPGTAATQPATGSLRPVTVGLINDDYAEILSGVSAGEVVLYQSAESSSSGNRNQFVVRTGGMSMPMMGF